MPLPLRFVSNGFAMGTLLTLGGWGVSGAAETPWLYRHIAAKHGLAGDPLYQEALRFSGRPSRYGPTPTPWPWTVRYCAAAQCETVYPVDRAAMAQVLVAGQAAGLTLYVGPLGLRWDPARLPLRAATSPRVTLNEAARQRGPARPPSAPALAYGSPDGEADRAARRADPARRWAPLIARVAQDEGIDPQLVHAVIRAESAYNPGAVSPQGAVGLMQLMPATAERFGLATAARHDPEGNLRAGIRYLNWLLNRFGHQLPLALAGYNAGEGAVDRYQGIPPYAETQAYVRKITRLLAEGGPS